MTKQFSVQLSKKIKIARNIYSFFFSKPKDFKYLPGQYLRIQLKHEDADEYGSSRFFTIASSPLDDYIMLTTKLRESSFKKALINLKYGENIQIFGPLGRFYLNENPVNNIVFLSGGMGITPFHSMMNYIHKKKLPIYTVLIASFKSVNEVIYYDVFNDIAKVNKSIKVIYTITGGIKNKNWSGERGRINEDLIKKYKKDYSVSEFYITGPQNMVDHLSKLLIEMQIPVKKIKTEIFTGY